MKLTFYWRKDKVNKEGKAPIYLNCRCSDGRYMKSTGLTDFEKFSIITKRKINDLEDALDEMVRIAHKKDQPITKVMVDAVLFPPSTDQTQEAILKHTFLGALDKFILDSENGKRRTKKGKRIKPSTIKQYNNLKKILASFKDKWSKKLDWGNIDLSFYHDFTDYCWDSLGHYDNRVGTSVKNLKAFLNWANEEEFISKKIYSSKWVTWKEEIDIVVLYPDELSLLINIELEDSVLDQTRDLFLMGCMTCFRVSNLLSLAPGNLVQNGNEMAIKIISVKTGQPVLINLNDLGKSIIRKYAGKYETLLPDYYDQKYNENLKLLAKQFRIFLEENKHNLKPGFIGNDWTKPFTRTRFKRGEPIYSAHDMTDLISSHTQRRTGITALLMMGLSVIEVSGISGHAFGSKEMGKYEKIAQQFIEKKAQVAWNTMVGVKELVVRNESQGVG